MIKKNILKKNWEFQEIINDKKQIVSKELILYFRKNEEHLKIGISISKKFANAVGRNKIRRQVRAILDEVADFNKKFDAILIIRKPFMGMDHENKKESIRRILERL